MFGTDVEAAARAHALEMWPMEACGVVSGGDYIRIDNIHEDPENGFRMPDSTWIDHAPQAVIHSHNASQVERNGKLVPLHPHYPSRSDMECQRAAAIPFGIVSCDGEVTTPVLWFGDHTLDAPLEMRNFVPGVYDCYALVRAWYWQNRGVKLPDYPRNDGWWKAGENLLADNFTNAGFAQIDKSEAAEGDVLLMRIMSDVPCHSAVFLDGGLMVHHLDGRLSVTEPCGRWFDRITHVVRYNAT